MSIQNLTFQINPGLKRELEFFSKTSDGLALYSEIRSPPDIIHWIETNPDYVDLKTFINRFPVGPLLDVGVGWGLTSAYLALKGFKVASLDPSPESCQGLDDFLGRLSLESRIYCSTAEAMDELREDFEYIVFWSSLHHCDDPLLALQNAHKLLRPGGWVILYEPVLRFFRSKRWFYRMMEKNPQKIGHYGGNEHIYRYGEYLYLLTRAGFQNLSSSPSLRYLLEPKRAPWDHKARWLLKRFYYRTTRKLVSGTPIIHRILLRLSLLTPLILAQKQH
jgi:SAM-dependent methyltransferase